MLERYAHKLRCFLAYLRGIWEADTDLTTHYDDIDLLEAYDRGRTVGRGENL
jgi:hypothetical protein